MDGHVVIGGVDIRLVTAGFGDTGTDIIRDGDTGDSVEIFEGVDMGVDPVGKRLIPGCLGISVITRSQDGHENLSLTNQSCMTIYDGNGLAGIINEHLFPRLVGLAEAGV